MKITASLQNSQGQHHVTLTTNDNSHSISIPPKLTGSGSSPNGGELLFPALATCGNQCTLDEIEIEVS